MRCQNILNVKNKIINFRKILWAILALANQIRVSRETNMAYTSLQRARNWTGGFLKAIGEETPYNVALDVSEIPDTADLPDSTLPKGFDGEFLWDFGGGDFSEEITLLDKVNYLREVIGQGEDTFDSLWGRHRS